LQKNIEEGRVPPGDILRRARTASALFGVLSCFLVFAIGYSAFDASIGLIAAALLMTSGLFRVLATQAMTDVFYNFFLLCGCLGLVLFYKTDDKRRALIIAGISGVLAGLACSVKITGLVIGAGVFLGALVIRFGFCVSRSRWKEIVGMVTAFSFGALLTVYALNPFFWPSWREVHAGAIFQELRLVSEHGISGITHTNGRYPQLRNLAQPLELPQLYFRWKRLMQLQQREYGWQGNRLLDFHMSLFNQRANLPGEFIFIGIGIIALFLKKDSRFLPKYDRSRAIPMLYFFVNYVFILFFIELNWSRYYLPTMIAGHVIAAVGFYAAVTYTYHSLFRYRGLRLKEEALAFASPQNSAADARKADAESSSAAPSSSPT
jgi:4-amino-4-deoxy-L-arabinose transferase-like glycosyltransferase